MRLGPGVSSGLVCVNGGDTPIAGHAYPSDPVLASAYMSTLRKTYEARNAHRAVVRGDSERKDIAHIQYFISFAEYENIPLDEMMAMVKELIERTPLKDHACLYAAHTNTWRPDDKDNPGNRHVHISVCPYPLMDGTHKLPVSDRTKNDIQRTMDRICVEHGYSIIKKRKLMGDEEYRNWFSEMEVAREITIHQSEKKSRRRRYQESEQRNLLSRSLGLPENVPIHKQLIQLSPRLLQRLLNLRICDIVGKEQALFQVKDRHTKLGLSSHHRGHPPWF